MKITKELKNVTFEYDEEKKTFTILEAEGFNGYVELNKVYAFAFMRFVVRMAQRNWLRTIPTKQNKEACELAEHPFEDPNQIEFCYDDDLLEESKRVISKTINNE
jgi:hypothetical protein